MTGGPRTSRDEESRRRDEGHGVVMATWCWQGALGAVSGSGTGGCRETRACDTGRAELRPQRVARVHGPARHGGPTLQSERTRLVCMTSLRPEDTSRGPGRAGAAPHGECPRPRGGPGRCGAAPRTPSRCRASGPQQRAQAAFSEDRGARDGAVAPSEEAALGAAAPCRSSQWLARATLCPQNEALRVTGNVWPSAPGGEASP